MSHKGEIFDAIGLVSRCVVVSIGKLHPLRTLQLNLVKILLILQEHLTRRGHSPLHQSTPIRFFEKIVVFDLAEIFRTQPFSGIAL